MKNCIEYAWKKKRDAVYKELEQLQQDVKLLDIGCNTGAELVNYANVKAGEFLGLDINTKFLKNDKVSYIRGDARFLPFKNNTFHIVTSTEVIEHFLEGERFLREVHRILKNNGKLILTTPNRSRITALPRTAFARLKRKEYVNGPIPEHVKEYTSLELNGILENIGFSIRSSHFIGFNPYLNIPSPLYFFLDQTTDKYFAQLMKWDMIIIAIK
jgi:ubiquinone/menaquinone biosynthesis C-methylase UbiE